MKQLLFFLSILFFIGCITEPSNELTTFQTTDMQLTLKLNGQLRTQNWSINPSLNPDVFHADCTEKENKVTFLDSKDSISFMIKEGDTTDFVIITESLDSAFTRIIGAQPNYDFTKEYIEPVSYTHLTLPTICSV